MVIIWRSIQGNNLYVVFFFSSRRRHTRLTGDWSSDVCSSDLGEGIAEPVVAPRVHCQRSPWLASPCWIAANHNVTTAVGGVERDPGIMMGCFWIHHPDHVPELVQKRDLPAG